MPKSESVGLLNPDLIITIGQTGTGKVVLFASTKVHNVDVNSSRDVDELWSYRLGHRLISSPVTYHLGADMSQCLVIYADSHEEAFQRLASHWNPQPEVDAK